MALLHYKWSRTAASNATADAAINMAEGMAPSAVNDGVRALMASAAGFRDDIAGAIATGGTSTAYTVTSYQVFDSLANMSGHLIAFTPHATNGATVTLNVDGLGAKPLRSAPSTELLAGTLIAGTPYTALYNNSDAAWYLQNFYVNPYQVPLGGMMDYIGSTAPNSAFVLPIGQAISRTTYATLFSLVSTAYGSGDGSTTFNVPDLTGRFTAMKEASATRLTSTYFGGNSTTLGATGGLESTTLTASQIPSITSTLTGTGTASTFQVDGSATNFQIISPVGGIYSFDSGGSGGNTIRNGTQLSASVSVTGTATSNNTSGAAHRTVPPTIIVNKILRVL